MRSFFASSLSNLEVIRRQKCLLLFNSLFSGLSNFRFSVLLMSKYELDVEDSFFTGFQSSMTRLVSTLAKGSLNKMEEGNKWNRDELKI